MTHKILPLSAHWVRDIQGEKGLGVDSDSWDALGRMGKGHALRDHYAGSF